MPGLASDDVIVISFCNLDVPRRTLMIRETPRSTLSGWVMLPVLIVALIALVYLPASGTITDENGVLPPVLIIASGIFILTLFFGFFVVNPNDARVLTLFGKYDGSVKRDGFHW